MNILILSTDKKIFEEKSLVRQRLLDYAELVDNLCVVVLNLESESYKKVRISEKCTVYPTNSVNKFLYIFDAIKIALNIKEFKSKDKKKIDLITAQDAYETGFIAWVMSRKIKTKLELQIHTDLFNKYFIKHSLANFFRSRIAKFLLSRADHIRVVSKRIQESLPKRLQKKPITIVPIFTSSNLIQVSTPNFSLKEKYLQFKFIILMMCRLESEKNISLAISAMKDVVDIFPKTGLIIVGEGSQRKSLRRLARRKGLEEKVIFKKWTDDPISYYKTADLFLSTSNYEGYGLSLVEAIVSKCPILTTKVGIVGEVLSGNNALLCEVGNEKCIAQSIKNIQQHPELIEELKEKAYNDFMQKIPQSRNENLALIKEGWLKTIND
ncbi:MAG: glycosyltransferase [Candidatus Pacebacteria bacterium]|nr:glycosyltransferase [Candidatus Paceibacterota bacterium]